MPRERGVNPRSRGRRRELLLEVFGEEEVSCLCCGCFWSLNFRLCRARKEPRPPSPFSFSLPSTVRVTVPSPRDFPFQGCRLQVQEEPILKEVALQQRTAVPNVLFVLLILLYRLVVLLFKISRNSVFYLYRWCQGINRFI